MTITLVVEDGSGVADANSIATAAQAIAYAALRGVTLTDTDALRVFLVKATDFLKSKSYLGTKANAGQAYLPWPRTGLVLDDEDFPEDEVPTDIVNAACQLCIEQFNGIDLAPGASGAAIKSEQVGPILTVYKDSDRAQAPRMPLVDALLAGWLVPSLSGFGLRTRRI